LKKKSLKNDRANLDASFQAQIGVKLPDPYKEFYLFFGPIEFNSQVKVECLDVVQFAGNSNKVDVNYFMDLCEDPDCGIISEMKSRPDEDWTKVIPICESIAGDLICLGIAQNNFNKVYYWYHEGLENNLFLIANSFEDFIFK
jgi:hypothetical protein